MIGHSAAILGAVAVVVAAGPTQSASGQPSDNQWPEQVYVSTAGNVRCVITAPSVTCERMGSAGFLRYPVSQPGGQGHVASVAADGTFSWAAAGIGGPTDPRNTEIKVAKSAPYRFHGWKLLLVADGTRLTNTLTLHGMLVSIDGATVTPF
jgi:hypothetical protein